MRSGIEKWIGGILASLVVASIIASASAYVRLNLVEAEQTGLKALILEVKGDTEKIRCVLGERTACK